MKSKYRYVILYDGCRVIDRIKNPGIKVSKLNTSLEPELVKKFNVLRVTTVL